MSEIEKGVSLPQHLWDALEQMAAEMGVSQEGLLAQAVFTLARLNGFIVPGKAGSAAAAPAPAAVAPGPRTMGQAPAAAAKPAPGKPAGGRRPPEPEPEPEPDAPPEDEEGNPFDGEAGEEDQQEEPQDEAPPDDEEPQEEEEQEEPEPEPAPRGGKSSGPTMTLTMAGREPFRLTSESMLVGRGKHCDFVIESNRVSREHARLSRQGQDFIIEDLKSSNGTFYGPGKERLAAETPRKLRDGDEITFGTEKVKVSIKR